MSEQAGTDPRQAPAEPTIQPETESQTLSIEQIEQQMEAARKALSEGKDPAPAEANRTETAPADTTERKETPGAAAPAAAEAAAGAPAEDPENPAKKKTETLEERVERLQRELRERDGRHGSDKQAWLAEKDMLNRQLQEALSRRAAEEAVTKATQEAARPPEPQEIADPTDEQLKAAFGEDYAEEMGVDHAKRVWLGTKRLQAEDRRRVETLVEERARKIEQERAAEGRLNRLFDEIEAAVPGARDLNEHATVNGFAAYLDGRFGETGLSRRRIAELAIEAVQQGCSADDRAAHQKTLASIFGGFAGTATPAANAQPKPAAPAAKPDPKLYEMPSTAGADRSPKGDTITKAEVDRLLQEAQRTGKVDEALATIRRKAAAGLIV